MSNILGVETALAPNKWDKETILNTANSWLRNDPLKYKQFKKFLNNSHNNSRYFSQTPEELLNLGALETGFALRKEQIFLEVANKLACEAIKKIAEHLPNKLKDIDGLIFTSCSCPTIPAVDVSIIQSLGLCLNITRVPIYQYGCAGGVAGLALASKLSKSIGNVLLISAELCSLVFAYNETDNKDLVAAAIFGDGAAATIVTPQAGEIEIIDTQSLLIPKSQHLMGYNPSDRGAQLRLDRELPDYLEELASEQVSTFLKKHNLTSEDIKWWLFHPGGAKIITILRKQLNVSDESSWFADKVLENYGNMSSATVLFVMKELLDSKQAKADDKILMLGIGPGLTLELILMKKY
jgi:alkylresorcinol/alkylpyrone synthase